jgi:hypothetical protein
MISIAHNGQELGQFSTEDVAAMLESGQIDQTAHYWMDGMPEWRLITEIVQVEVAERVVAEANDESSSKTAKSKRDPNAPNKAHLNFLSRRNIPADGLTKESAAALVEQVKQEEERERKAITPRQKAFLDYHRIRYNDKTTKEEASVLIGKVTSNQSKWRKERHLLHPDLYDPPFVIPLTEDQRAILDYHEVKYAPEIQREEASELIHAMRSNSYYEHSKWGTYKHLIRPDLYKKPEASPSAKEELTETRQRLNAADLELRRLRSMPTAESESIEDAEQQVQDLRAEVQDMVDEIEDDRLSIKEGTDDASSFVDAWAEGSYEPTGESVERFTKIVKKPTKAQFRALREKLVAELGIGLSVLSLDQFLCLYVQQYPEALKEGFRTQKFPSFVLRIPKTYSEQLQLEGVVPSGRATTTLLTRKRQVQGVFLTIVLVVAILLLLVLGFGAR